MASKEVDADKNAHPWPPSKDTPGERCIDIRWRKGTWMLIRPWYGYNNKFIPITAVERMTPIHFWFPFVTVWTRWFHFYYGWKPLTLDDPGFWWRDLDIVKKWREEGRLFVQLSGTQGIGSRA